MIREAEFGMGPNAKGRARCPFGMAETFFSLSVVGDA